MQIQSFKVFSLSSLAVVIFAVAVGIQLIPKQTRLGEQAVRESVEQELVSQVNAAKMGAELQKLRLVDALKSSENLPLDSVFTAVALFEWDGDQWKAGKHLEKVHNAFPPSVMATWPLAQTKGREVQFLKVADVNGEAHFALLTALRNARGQSLVGVGVFPASRFGMQFSADHQREIKVFNERGYAIAMSRPIYAGASLTNEELVREMISSEEVSLRKDWSVGSRKLTGAATRIAGTNLFVAIESPLAFGRVWFWQALFFLGLAGLGAILLNWWIFRTLLNPLLDDLSRAEYVSEDLRKAHLVAQVPAELSGLDFSESVEPEESVEPIEIPTDLPSQDPQLEEPPVIASHGVFSDAMSGEEPVRAGHPLVSLRKVIQASLRSLDQRLRTAEVEVELSDFEFMVHSESLQLQTAVEEIIKNAIESMEGNLDSRKLTIRATLEAGQVCLFVQDNGAGIPDQDLDNVFTPFFTTKGGQESHQGLGLNVVRRVVEEMKGSIQIQNTIGGRGVTVSLNLLGELPIEREIEVRRPIVRSLE